MEAADSGFIPAAGRFAPVGLYDIGIRLTMREDRWREVLAREVGAAVGMDGSVVEIGAGTGSLTARIRDLAAASATVNAVDPDERALAIARRKLGEADVNWIVGRGEAVPLADESQDAVVTALVLHHLLSAQKGELLAEARRLLRPGGTLLVADFGPPHDPLMRAAFQAIRLLDGRETTAGHLDGIVGQEIPRAGFEPPTTLLRLRTVVGSLQIWRATRPADAG